MKKIHRQRLARLTLALLEASKGQKLMTPKGKTLSFDMQYFVSNGETNEWGDPCSLAPEKAAICGTSCCFLGYAPFVMPHTRKLRDWGQVCGWVTGFRLGDNSFDFLFGPEWGSVPSQTIRRALLLLERPEIQDEDEGMPVVMEDKRLKPYARLTRKQLKERLEAFL